MNSIHASSTLHNAYQTDQPRVSAAGLDSSLAPSPILGSDQSFGVQPAHHSSNQDIPGRSQSSRLAMLDAESSHRPEREMPTISNRSRRRRNGQRLRLNTSGESPRRSTGFDRLMVLTAGSSIRIATQTAWRLSTEQDDAGSTFIHISSITGIQNDPAHGDNAAGDHSN